jgi:predicted dehydrogenase
LVGYEFEVGVLAVPPGRRGHLLYEMTRCCERVVVEKPLAHTADEAVRIAETCDPRRVFLAESQAYGVAFERARGMINSGQLGTPLLWRACYMTSYAPQVWTYDPATGGGALLEGGVHMLAVAARLFGKSVRATGAWSCFKREWQGMPALSNPMPDTGAAVVQYAAGHILHLGIAWGTRDCLRGALPTIGNSSALIGPLSCASWSPADDHEAMWDALLDCAARGEEPHLTLQHGAQAVADAWACMAGSV